jgi:hypothetical protein
VRERDLSAATAREVVVDDDAVVDHELGRPLATGGLMTSPVNGI